MAEKIKGDEFPLKAPRPEDFLAKVSGQQLWSFMYAVSPSVKFTGTVGASTEELAVKVAERWCRLNEVRLIGAKVKPMILADESILAVKVAEEVPA